jgi:DNA transposition AAA+ family ATPase
LALLTGRIPEVEVTFLHRATSTIKHTTMEQIKQQLTLPGAEAVQQMSAVEVRELVALLSDHGVTRRAIADEAGYSPSALSSWMNGRYSRKDGDEEDRTFETTLRSALERILQKRFNAGNRESRKFRRVKTSVADAVFLAARTCQYQGLMGILTGRGGRGKTTAAEMYAAANANVVYVPTSKFMTGKQLMRAIGEQIDVQEKSSHDSLMKICEKLRNKKSLIIIDESENISLDLLDSVRHINDLCGAGLLFIGQEPFYTMLAKARKAHEYLVDRFKLRMRVSDLGLKDVEMLVSTEITQLNGHTASFLDACGGSARFLETIVYKLLPRIQAGEELSARVVAETAEAVKIF